MIQQHDPYPYRIFSGETSPSFWVLDPTCSSPLILLSSNRSDGPMVRCYYRYVPILRTFFLTEFRGPAAPLWPADKIRQIFPEESCPGESLPGETFPGVSLPGETFPGETIPGESFPGEHFPGETFQGKAFQGNLFQGKLFQEKVFQGKVFQGNLFQGK